MTKVITAGEIEYDEAEFYLKFLHDLRSGLTIIGGYASLVLEEATTNLTDEQKESLQHIKKSYQNMIDMVNDVTDLVRINTGTITLHKKELDLKEAVNKAVESIKTLLAEKDITLELNLLPQPMLIVGDFELLEKALNHIFVQLIDLLAMGSVIKLNAASKEKSWIISLKDNGPGIPSEEIPNLFKPFFVSNFLSTLGKKSVGLNLIVAKKIIGLHEGKMQVESKPGYGTTINVELPVKKELERQKILIIEDNLVIARMWETKLKKDFVVILAGNGTEGIDQAKNQQPDLIILDVLMPGMDGFEVCKQIKTIPSLRETPVIFLSNLVQEHMLEKAKELGAVDFIAKSTIDPTTLANKIKEYLKPESKESKEKSPIKE